MIDLTKYNRIVGGYLFFLKGHLSQWWKAEMVENDVVFNCCEQYMMYHKAKLFNDEITANQIIKSKEPYEQKRLGRIVKNFDEAIWNKHKEDIVYQGNLLKFTSHENLKELLLRTQNLEIVEANGYDRIWGIGMFDDDEDLLRTELWGQNLLGKALMKVREFVKTQNQMEIDK